jgi:molecular chaperone DnaK (HSP70)
VKPQETPDLRYQTRQETPERFERRAKADRLARRIRRAVHEADIESLEAPSKSRTKRRRSYSKLSSSLQQKTIIIMKNYNNTKYEKL